MTIIPIVGKWNQEDHNSKVILSYTSSLRLPWVKGQNHETQEEKRVKLSPEIYIGKKVEKNLKLTVEEGMMR